MNKLCKEYISDAKKFFPVMGKNERAYLRGIVSELEDCIERESVTTKQELYTKYRQPYDLATDYYSRLETEDIVKKIGLSRYIKAFIVFILISLLAVSAVFLISRIHKDIVFSRESMVGFEESVGYTEPGTNPVLDSERSSNASALEEIENEEIFDEEEIIE